MLKHLEKKRGGKRFRFLNRIVGDRERDDVFGQGKYAKVLGGRKKRENGVGRWVRFGVGTESGSIFGFLG